MSEAASDYAIYRQVVTQLMSGEEQLPSLPTITLDIRRALSDPEVTLVQLSRLISRDPALSAILMKYASSALLRTQQPPKSLLDVLRVLGMAQVEQTLRKAGYTQIHEIERDDGLWEADVSRADGRFSASNLTVGGPFTITASSDGFEGQTINDVATTLQGATDDPAITTRTVASRRVAEPAYLHSFGMSSRYLVIAEFLNETAGGALFPRPGPARWRMLTLHALGPNFDFERSLAEGDLDVVIGNWPEPPHRMHLSMLLEDEIVCLVAASHPCAKKGMSVEDYMRAAHVVPMPYSISQRGVIDGVLEVNAAPMRKKRIAAPSACAARAD